MYPFCTTRFEMFWGRQQDAVGEHREQYDDGYEGDEDAVAAEVGQDVAEPAGELVVAGVDTAACGSFLGSGRR
jgi:hypothetical protein